ncbi:hypothetical protein GIB67_036611 [Kingdonia uniflora]|uniref:Pentatricopeptide repeat-containing protein n=1 Tax=Kingdonia uniflora TaxID=39325 RepID=A0A7J7M0I3_9MAGN|nr:hypothetical protein GIB67_036611 [Kingdonia uniflora]
MERWDWGYVQCEEGQAALRMSKEMFSGVGVEPNDGLMRNWNRSPLMYLLQSRKNLVEPDLCKTIHSRVITKGFECNELVKNTLVDACAKCSLVELAWKLFEMSQSKDVVQ